MFKLKIIAILVTVIGLRQIESKCNICSTNSNTACIDETKFHICIDGKMDESMTLECPKGEMCTDLSIVCVAKENSNAVPGCTSLCGVCQPGKPFACTGESSYALCSDNTLTNVTGVCPQSRVCDIAGTSLCAESCQVKTLTCNKKTTPLPTTASPTLSPPTPSSSSSSSSTSSSSSSSSSSSTPRTPTPTPPMTPPTTNQTPKKTAQEVCNEKNIPGRFAYSDIDYNRCDDKHVWCRYQGSRIVAIASKCPTGRSFDRTTQSCVLSPAGCAA